MTVEGNELKTNRAKSLCAPLAEECGRDDMGKNVDHCSWVTFHRSVHVRVTVLQTNKQPEKCLLVLITAQAAQAQNVRS